MIKSFPDRDRQTHRIGTHPTMQLGNFSLSLNVNDLAASKIFYEKLGYKVFMGDLAKNMLIMKNGDHIIGLFHGMFRNNIMTFNPGWDSNSKKLPEFTDVRDIQKSLKAQGIKFQLEADETGKGPASFMIADPDGNVILVDQHV